MGMPYTVLMPVIAATVLHGGPSHPRSADDIDRDWARSLARCIWRRDRRCSVLAE